MLPRPTNQEYMRSLVLQSWGGWVEASSKDSLISMTHDFVLMDVSEYEKVSLLQK